MSINLQDILIALGGQAAFLGAVAWLGKSLISHRLAQEAEEFKAKLRADADIEIERLKSSLQILAAERQVRFAKLHEKRAEVIAQLYAMLVDARRLTQEFVYGGMHEVDRRRKAYDKAVELYQFIDTNRIYLQPAVCALLDKFHRNVRGAASKIEVLTLNWTGTENLNETQNQLIIDAATALESDLPAIREQLEEEFRAMLGVESPASPAVHPKNGPS